MKILLLLLVSVKVYGQNMNYHDSAIMHNSTVWKTVEKFLADDGVELKDTGNHNFQLLSENVLYMVFTMTHMGNKIFLPAPILTDDTRCEYLVTPPFDYFRVPRVTIQEMIDNGLPDIKRTHMTYMGRDFHSKMAIEQTFDFHAIVYKDGDDIKIWRK